MRDVEDSELEAAPQAEDCVRMAGELGTEVHLWWLRHGGGEPPGAACALLSREEAEQAARFVPEVARVSFLWRRWLRREVLSRYTGIPADELRFEGERFEKPVLPQEQGLEFSTSSRPGVAVVALARGEAVGVDVELPRPAMDLAGLAHKYFRKAEREWFEAAPEPEQAAVFARIWSLKEAYLKMVGTGLAGDARAFRLDDPSATGYWVPIVPGDDPGSDAPPTPLARAWPLGLRDGVAACVVTPGGQRRLREFALGEAG